ncbi:hypothetical protein ABES02_18830 [Neobacillus pocheonensis]|uniref:hypothetical protein n=1 Tax=Neobacillus pocheonensis TaxID=363869 RepID=UPI003D27B0C6
MKNSHSLIFIGEREDKQNLRITRKPSFFDAILLSKQLSHPTRTPSYEAIPLGSNANISIHFFDSNIHLIYKEQSLQIFSRNYDLTESEVFDFFNHFAIKEGSTISYLSLFPRGKTSRLKKKKARVLSEEKELEVSEEREFYGEFRRETT